MNQELTLVAPEGLPRKMTLAEFLAHDIEGYEYVNGELVPMSPPTMEHGEISVSIIRYLDWHVHENQLGRVYTAETTFQIGERALKPDIAFVSTARLPENRKQGSPIPPDLAVEVVSPTDRQAPRFGKGASLSRCWHLHGMGNRCGIANRRGVS